MICLWRKPVEVGSVFSGRYMNLSKALQWLSLVDKIQRMVPSDLPTSPCVGGPIDPTARMLLSGSDH